MSTALSILATGARTPVGRTAAGTAAAVRAGISRLTEHPFMVDKAGEPFGLAADVELEAQPRHERIAILGSSALRQVLSREGVPLAPSVEVPVFAVLPEVDEMFTAAAVTYIAAALERAVPGQKLRVLTLPNGHAGGALALERARAAIEGRLAPLAVVLGADSYIDADVLERLDADGRVMSAQTKWGFPPGEGAGALLVGPPGLGRSLGLTAHGRVVSAVTDVEVQVGAEAVNTGEGLGRAFRRALAGLRYPAERVAHTFIDLNGERHRDSEWSFALGRAPHQAFVEAEDFSAPADCWGDVGAATLPLFAILATQAGLRGYPKGQFQLLCAASRGGLRGAIVLDVASPRREGSS